MNNVIYVTLRNTELPAAVTTLPTASMLDIIGFKALWSSRMALGTLLKHGSNPSQRVCHVLGEGFGFRFGFTDGG